MEQFNKICKDLELDFEGKKDDFQRAWDKFQITSKKMRCKSLSYHEGFLAWALVDKFKPEVIIEIGGQFGHSGQIWLDAAEKHNLLFISIELGKDPRNKYTSYGDLRFLPDNHPNMVKVFGSAEEELPKLLQKYNVELVFHDAAHTWDHVEKCLTTVKDFNEKIIQTCHDCKLGMWKPNIKTQYGYVHAERPVFDKYYLNNPDYYYQVLEDKYGFGMAIPHQLLS